MEAVKKAASALVESIHNSLLFDRSSVPTRKQPPDQTVRRGEEEGGGHAASLPREG